MIDTSLAVDLWGMRSLVFAYLRLLHVRNCSPTFITSAKSTLLLAESFIDKPLENATHADISRWLDHRADVVTPRTLATQVSTLRGFFRYAVDEGMTRVDPMARIRPPKVPKLLPRPMADARIAAAWQAADDRMRVVIALGAFAGLRCCEIARLTWADLYLDDATPYLRIVGKGNKERVVDVSPALVDALATLPHRKGPVIRRLDGKPGPTTANRVSQEANEHLRACGFGETFHATRHRFVSVVTRAAGIRVAAELAGHASLTTTMGYAQVDRSDTRPAVVAAGSLRAS